MNATGLLWGFAFGSWHSFQFHCITHMIFLQLREAACTAAQRTYAVPCRPRRADGAVCVVCVVWVCGERMAAISQPTRRGLPIGQTPSSASASARVISSMPSKASDFEVARSSELSMLEPPRMLRARDNENLDVENLDEERRTARSS